MLQKPDLWEFEGGVELISHNGKDVMKGEGRCVVVLDPILRVGGVGVVF